MDLTKPVSELQEDRTTMRGVLVLLSAYLREKDPSDYEAKVGGMIRASHADPNGSKEHVEAMAKILGIDL
jgi:hypothetical protein